VNVPAATEEDVPAVLAIEAQVFGVDAWSEPSVREEITGPRRRAVLACDPDVVGYVVTSAVGDTVDLQRLVVHPRHRRRGLARSLLKAVSDDGRMLLEVGAANRGALALYAAEGFREIHRRPGYYRDGSEAVVMERR